MIRRLTAGMLVAALASAFLPVGGVAFARSASTKASPDYDGERVVVGIQHGRKDDVLKAARRAGARVVQHGGHDKFVVLEPGVGTSPDALTVAMSDEAGVAYSDRSFTRRAAFVPNDTSYGSQWNLQKIAAPDAWNITRGSSAVKIAIVDTGVDVDHPDLVDGLDLVNDRDFVDNDSVADDGMGHGTHVAGIAAAQTNNGLGVAGVAGGCTLLPVRVLNNSGIGSDPVIAEGIMYAADQGADVINLSLAGDQPASVLDDAITYARAKGSIVVAAAGNDSTSLPYYPAASPGAFAVSATRLDDTLAAYSNFGSYIDISAPGGDSVTTNAILSTTRGGGYGRMVGTSMAAPVVSGVVALVKSTHPTWDESEVLGAVQASAVDLWSPGRDDRYGFGRVSAGDALNVSTPDDDVPGVALAPSPLSGRIAGASDAHDVYAVRLAAGRTLSAQVTGNSGSSVEIRILGPSTSSIASPDIVSSSGIGGYPRVLAHTVAASEDATYYVDVTTAGASATYTLSWSLGYPTQTTAGASASLVDYGRPVTVAGTTSGNVPLPVGIPVQIERSAAGGPWAVVAQTAVDGSGGFSAVVNPKSNSRYRAHFLGQGEFTGSYSVPVAVSVRASLTAPSAPSWVRVKRSFAISGYLRPKHVAGQRSVKVRCFRSENGKWVLRRTVYAKNYSISSYTKYSSAMSLPYRGRWRLVACVEGDAAHVKTYSVPRYVTVK